MMLVQGLNRPKVSYLDVVYESEDHDALAVPDRLEVRPAQVLHSQNALQLGHGLQQAPSEDDGGRGGSWLAEVRP